MGTGDMSLNTNSSREAEEMGRLGSVLGEGS